MTDQTDQSINTHAPSVVQIETSKLMPMLIVLAILCGAAISMAWFARDRACRDAST